tara:strand:- start:208 stop:567 length:360 start_codon:yes stop_codon:yes gene_type:complete
MMQEIINTYCDPINNVVEYNKLEKLRKIIENLDKTYHIEIAKILKKHNVKLTENINGVFINMNLFTPNIIDSINDYLNFIKSQENYINIHEEKKETLQNIYFKDNKDNFTSNNDYINNV